MAMYQSPVRVCVEFLKSSGGIGKGRLIKLNYSPQQIPQQLYGRVDPVGLPLSSLLASHGPNRTPQVTSTAPERKPRSMCPAVMDGTGSKVHQLHYLFVTVLAPLSIIF